MPQQQDPVKGGFKGRALGKADLLEFPQLESLT